MKVFNVDALAKETRHIVLDGQQHEVVPMNVESFLKTLEVADALEQDKSTASQINGVVKMINAAIPTLSEDRIRKMPLEHMNAISEFVRGEIPEVLKPAAAEQVVANAEGDAEKK